MRATTIVALLSLSSNSLAWAKSGKWDRGGASGNSTISYTTITGFFQQDDPATDPKSFDYTKSNFGLIERSYPTDGEFDPKGEKTQWQRFEHYVNALNHNATKDTQYKVLFMGRHGEGYHNAAESYYGTPAWNCYWGPLDGNGTVTWRDAHLTEAGIAQCSKAHEFWALALAESGLPAPQTYHSSPLTRSATTANLTFGGLPLPAGRPFAPTIKELLREGFSPRTCDHRSDVVDLRALLPASFRFEPGFAEADPLWRAGEGETADAVFARTKAVLDDVFATDQSTWISLTTHSGQIAQNLKVLGHIEFALTTGQAIPALVRAETRGAAVPATTVASFTAEATCGAPPVTSVSGRGCVCSNASSSTLVAVAETTTPV
ncbi:phosphoglycerate mutase-like protein [Xylariaceae sp. FL0662B]|nr:phosphoglycerate mutase-like protein [Xylariaceae sp. FL0662B]